MRVVHLTAKLYAPWRNRLEGERAAWLWAHLRRAFPSALAVTLMPNHPHVVAVVASIEQAHATFVKVLAAFSRRFSLTRPVWFPIPQPEVVSDADKILRQFRYVALNAARARLVNDPLSWYWSTYRDVLGATDDPWVTLDAVRPYMPEQGERDAAELHRFVSSDPTTDVAGTPFPAPAPDMEIATRPLGAILKAAVIATRATMHDHRRRGPTRDAFVCLAVAQGWHDTAELARLCDVTPNAIARILRGPPPNSLTPARLCLGDRRLLTSVDAPTGLCAPERVDHGRSTSNSPLSNGERTDRGRSPSNSPLPPAGRR